MPADDEELGRWLDQLGVDGRRTRAAAALVVGDGPLRTAARGLDPHRPGRVGALTKPLVAGALLEAAGRGWWDLGRPLVRTPEGEAITAGDVLSHTTGHGEPPDGGIGAALGELPRLGIPGRWYSYSGHAFAAGVHLGARSLDRTVPDLVAELVAQRAGLVCTSLDDGPLAPSDGASSSAADLARLGRWSIGRWPTTSSVPGPGRFQVAPPWFRRSDGGVITDQHGGIAAGTASIVVVLPGRGAACAVVCTGQRHRQVQVAAAETAPTLVGPARVPVEVTDRASSDPAWAGAYADANRVVTVAVPDQRRVVAVIDDRRSADRRVVSLRPCGPDRVHDAVGPLAPAGAVYAHRFLRVGGTITGLLFEDEVAVRRSG